MYLKILDIQIQNDGSPYVKFGVWRDQAGHDAGDPAAHVNDWLMSDVGPTIRVTNAQGWVKLKKDGSFVDPDTVSRDQIVFRRKTKAEMRESIMRRLRWYVKTRSDKRGDETMPAARRAATITATDPRGMRDLVEPLLGEREEVEDQLGGAR